MSTRSQLRVTQRIDHETEDGEEKSTTSIAQVYRHSDGYPSGVPLVLAQLKAVKEEFGEDLIVVLDNAPYFASKKVKKFAKGAGIDLCYLPRYSPQMNLVEECWRQLNQQLKNRVFDDIDHLNRAIQNALRVVNPLTMFNYLYPSL